MQRAYRLKSGMIFADQITQLDRAFVPDHFMLTEGEQKMDQASSPILAPNLFYSFHLFYRVPGVYSITCYIAPFAACIVNHIIYCVIIAV